MPTTAVPTTIAARDAEAETLARAFAAAWPTPNTRRAIALCETGTLRWVDVAALFARSYATAKTETGQG